MTNEEIRAEQAAARPPELPDDRPPRLKDRSPYRPGRGANSSVDLAWNLEPGTQIKRTELHARFGGGGQGGIAPCRDSRNVLVFSDPEVGGEHGYHDRWESDEVFLYCGEGQQGDQQLIRGNRAILDHRRIGRALRVFEGCRGVVRYVGEFEIDPVKPYVWETARGSGGGAPRRVVMFRLRPLA